MEADIFKVPSTIPQDILLIHDLVSPVVTPTQPVTPRAADSDDSVDSSGESTDSVEEVEANIVSVGKVPRRFVSYLKHPFLRRIFC
jgi:H/ACA ribonucleoprotein complex non-core subunit NAF1